jgi:hypothetical protein
MKSTNYLRLILLLLAGSLGAQSYAQPVRYTYDASGNRVSRAKVINMPSKAKSSVGESATEETATAEAPKFEDILAEMKITIYPNPTKGMLRVDITGGEIPGDAKIYIYNLFGNLIRQVNGISGSNTVDISPQPPGTYIMRIVIDKDHVSSWKIIKE